MQIIETIGNRQLMDREKTVFLCSKNTPIGLYEQVFRWTDSLTENDCIACFNSTDMESEVLKALLVARIPTVLFVMNRFTDVCNLQIEQALNEKRMLIVVLKRDEPRGKGQTPRLRNEFVLSQCQHIVCGYVNKNGSVFGLLAGRKNVTQIVSFDNQKVAEPDNRKERWTVAQDKVLLRMFYADLGIHAIHKQLQRTYAAIYTRIHSITQSEELLKGREFEDYVLSMFDIREDSQLVLQEWQGDKSFGTVMPENNSNPDFVFRFGDREFAVECKWREMLDRDLERDMFPKRRIENYRGFAEKRKMPVFIVLGVGGEPSTPELLYSIPLESIEAVVSGSKSITDFLVPSLSFDPIRFLPSLQKSSQKSYTFDEKTISVPQCLQTMDERR